MQNKKMFSLLFGIFLSGLALWMPVGASADYPATLDGGVVYDKIFYYYTSSINNAFKPDGTLGISATYCDRILCTSYNKLVNAPVAGYAASAPFPGSVPLYCFVGGQCYTKVTTACRTYDPEGNCIEQVTAPVYGYVSSTSLGGKAVYERGSAKTGGGLSSYTPLGNRPQLGASYCAFSWCITCGCDRTAAAPLFGYLAPSPGTYGGTPSCASKGGTLSADKKTCLTTTACSAVTKSSLPGYACPAGENLSGSICSYGATLSGGASYNKALYNWGNSGGIKCKFPNSISDKDLKPTCFGSALIGYASTSNFSNSVTIYKASLRTTYAPYCRYVNGNQATDSFSTSPSHPNCSSDVLYLSKKSITGVGVSVLGGYIASSSGTFGDTYSCKSGHSLSGSTCSHPATPTYSCSNVCSNLYNNTQSSFTSSDAACTTPVGPVTYSLNCNCGVSATKSNLAFIDSSACTACTNTPSTNFTLTVKAGTNTTVRDSVGTVSAVNESKTFSFAAGTVVTLSAAAMPGSTLDAWTGDSCAGNAATACTFTMDKARNVATSASVTSCTDNCATTQCGQACTLTNCTTNPTGGTDKCPAPMQINNWREVAP